ncbi:4'-phosphopantetheinyl transferase family protein [Cellulomonas soli]|uniref:4'-phosphopantetheinyl transferase n=1 Tax=Cellulomonas soli TaxID=931535 RepID=A0A512PHF9_9CELL|nr:4'-phosphopantetheinyl transferase superfamily protein [Cellulomonas soli]NYI60780.1 4'-phosphopantetheinyl transferase [Cellulomonas soli]GEP70636.1 4'-phosphopantetheinyl transferase [Cellulomonas soli]
MRRADGDARVEVWSTAPLDVDDARLLPVLDHGERARAEAMADDSRARFVQTRALLRAVLGARLGLAPHEVTLRAPCPVCGGPHGPVTVGLPVGTSGPRWHVSVSRSGPLLAVALGPTGPLGIDVESHARVAQAPLAGVALSPAERRRYDRLPHDGRVAALARAWVRKEAVLKAEGSGLRVDPALVDVRADLVRLDHAPGGAGAVARLVDLDLGPGVSGALARRAGPAARPEAAARVPDRLDVVVHDGAPVVDALLAR